MSLKHMNSLHQPFSCIVILFYILMFAPVQSNASTLVYNNNDPDSYVTAILGLDIDGTLYDATFYIGIEFLNLWDIGNNEYPTFFETVATTQQALTAANAVMNALGSEATTNEGFYEDSFFLPYGLASGVEIFYDERPAANDDAIGYTNMLAYEAHPSIPYVKFELSTVPLPGAFWLLASGIIGIGLIGRNRKKK